MFNLSIAVRLVSTTAGRGFAMSIMEWNDALALPTGPVEHVRLATLPVGHAWRADGLDEVHVTALAGVLEATPPIVVSRCDMTIVDGAHRVAAARRRGSTSLRVEWFDGNEVEALHEFLRRNTHHGLPVTAEDRERGMQRTLRLEPEWSDRRIAHLCGVSPKLVARTRGDCALAGVEKRVGLDGRSRPVRPGAMRQQIAEALESDPCASLRVIAARLGVSPETVRSVRKELHHASPHVSTSSSFGPSVDLADQYRLLLQRRPTPTPWRDDHAFHSTEDGVSFVEWFDATSISGGAARVDEVPLSRVYEIADEARRRVAFWSTFADDLERRTRNRR